MIINNNKIKIGFVLRGFTTNNNTAKSTLEKYSMFSISTLAITVSLVDVQKKKKNNKHVFVEGSKQQQKLSTKAKKYTQRIFSIYRNLLIGFVFYSFKLQLVRYIIYSIYTIY